MGKTIKNTVLRLIKRKSFEEKGIPELKDNDGVKSGSSLAEVSGSAWEPVGACPTAKLETIEKGTLSLLKQKMSWFNDDIARLEASNCNTEQEEPTKNVTDSIKKFHYRLKQGNETCMRLLEELDCIVISPNADLSDELRTRVRERRKTAVQAVQALLNDIDGFAERISRIECEKAPKIDEVENDAAEHSPSSSFSDFVPEALDCLCE